MSGCGGCAGEQDVLCLGQHHHPCHALDLDAGSEGQENIVFTFNIILFISFVRRGPGSVRSQSRTGT